MKWIIRIKKKWYFSQWPWHHWNPVKILSYANNMNIVYKQTLKNCMTAIMVMLQLIAYTEKNDVTKYLFKKYANWMAFQRWWCGSSRGATSASTTPPWRSCTRSTRWSTAKWHISRSWTPPASPTWVFLSSWMSLSVCSHRCAFRIHLLAQGERKRIISFEMFFLCFSQRKWSVLAWRQTSGGRMCLFWCTRWQISAPLTSVHASSSSSTTTKEGGDSLPPGSVFFLFIIIILSWLLRRLLKCVVYVRCCAACNKENNHITAQRTAAYIHDVYRMRGAVKRVLQREKNRTKSERDAEAARCLFLASFCFHTRARTPLCAINFFKRSHYTLLTTAGFIHNLGWKCTSKIIQAHAV